MAATKNRRERFLTSRSDGPEGVTAVDGRPQKSPQAYGLRAFCLRAAS